MNPALAFGNGGEHGITMGNRFVAREANLARDAGRGGNPFLHEEFPILAGDGRSVPAKLTGTELSSQSYR